MTRHLILWRHADAGHPLSDANADFARPLSASGRARAAQIARWMSARLTGPVHVVSSPAQRTRQTAAALAADAVLDERLAPDTGVEAYLDVVRDAIAERKHASVVLVGHQPMLGALAARLLLGEDLSLAFHKAACWWFRMPGDPGEAWSLDIAMHPDWVDPPQH